MISNFIDTILQDKLLSGNSERFANWMSQLAINTCRICFDQHGKIVDISYVEDKYHVNAHEKCKCIYVPMRTKTVGTATDLWDNGADKYLWIYGILPNYYVDKNTAYNAGWKRTYKQLSDALPGKVIGGDVYQNRDFKLPWAPGRVWYEADINYNGGKRGKDRILYSNDGLIFITYDHYKTFYELTP